MIGVVLVHYHTPELLQEALERLGEGLAGSAPGEGGEADVVVVDNGSTAEGRRLLDGLPVRVLRPGSNLGYAGGVNAGVEAVRGEHLVLMNPDVLVEPGCLRRLIEVLENGASAAGPRFTWDRQGRLLLPPAEERTRRNELFGRLAHLAAPVPSAVPASPAPDEAPSGDLHHLSHRDGLIVRRYRHRWRRHARRHWDASESLATEALSGALLAVRRDAWEAIGPFDEGYRLYFEETDWLRRLARSGATAVHVPAARAVHLYDRSASSEPRAGEWFAASRRRFERRWYGAPFAALLAALDRRPSASVEVGAEVGAGPEAGAGAGAGYEPPGGSEPREVAADPPFVDAPLSGLREPLWVEISPSPLGVPAAAERVGSADAVRSWRLPQEIIARLPSGRFRLQVVGDGGVEGICAWIRVPDRDRVPRSPTGR